ncbi:ArsR/SmtB family transcription factor [Jeongeupia naejangsanensis]|uniref:Helix-turn-helix transcriptional regulator n=1 Tax=Jeongeupia naejangsanensis TaxID=613195 RepID=A0ABS2BMN9_9NEIS|nr:metalloregulator ArsR/SmtB family transcription factor [Jeongeupia naejangsanensis]MBM3116872.1 helix-turn-helix transcriptional regulator [Jeongeupia naejangsanensis]
MSAAPPELERMRSAASEAVDLLKTLANQDRLLLLCRMSQGERNVGELEADLDIHQPTLSQQLGVLRRAGLVTTRKDGKQVYYSLANAAAIAVIGTLYQQFCGNEEARS